MHQRVNVRTKELREVTDTLSTLPNNTIRERTSRFL